MLAPLWNNTLIVRRWNACQKNCAIIGKAIKSFLWIGRGGGWCSYEKGAAESILYGDSESDSEVAPQRGCVCDEA